MIGIKVRQILCPLARLHLELVNPGNSVYHSGLPGLSTPNDFLLQSRITTSSTICTSYLLTGPGPVFRDYWGHFEPFSDRPHL